MNAARHEEVELDFAAFEAELAVLPDHEWRPDEEEALRRYYREYARRRAVDTLAARLGKTKGDVYYKATRMGLTRRLENEHP